MRLYPSSGSAQAGEKLELYAVIFNHAAEAREFRVRLRAPEGWQAGEGSVTVGPREEGRLALEVVVPASAKGLRVVTADVAWSGGELREWAEALLEVRP